MDNESKKAMPTLNLSGMTMKELIAAKEAGLLGSVVKQEIKEPFPKEVITQKQLNLKLNKLFKSLAKSMWAPVVQEIVEPIFKNDITQSKYFGSPWLYAKEDWPLLDNKPLVFVFQLNIETLPREMSEKLGGKGLLQFFYEPNSWSGDEGAFIRIVDTKKAGKTLPQPKVVDYVIPNEKLITDWKEYVDYPHHEELSLNEEYNRLDYLAQLNDLEINEPECYQGDKLGGYPFWTQAGYVSTDYIYQLDAGCLEDDYPIKAHAPNLFAGDGTGHIFVPTNDESEYYEGDAVILDKEGYFDWACG